MIKVIQDEMEFKIEYELKNWKTKEIQIIKAPERIFDLNFKEIVSIFGNYGFGLNIAELTFLLIFHLEGWGIIRLPLNRYHWSTDYILTPLKREFMIEEESLFCKGCPDFLLTNNKKKEFKFVEIKQWEDSLNDNQIRWVEKYNYNVFITRLISQR